MTGRSNDKPETDKPSYTSERTDVAPQADRWIKDHGGIVGIEQSDPSCVIYRLADGLMFVHWDGEDDRRNREFGLVGFLGARGERPDINEGDGVTCAECDGAVSVAIEDVRPHGARAVFTCTECGESWINTAPSVAEQVIVKTVASRVGDDFDHEGYTNLGADEHGDRHLALDGEAMSHCASPSCGCNPDHLGDDWIHHSFGADA